MKSSTRTFTSGLKRIEEFLYRSENINHNDVVYMNFARGIGIFQHKTGDSHIYLSFNDNDELAEVHFSLQGEDSIIHQWVRMFQDDFGATSKDIDQSSDIAQPPFD